MPEETYYRKKIHAAVAHLDSHLQEDLRVDELARIAGFSAFHFSRLYKSLQGETPYQTLLRLRLEKAVFLLKYHPEMKIADIAFEVGFSAIENFTRQFKSRFDITPAAFRDDPEKHKSRIYQEPQPNDFYTRIEESRKSSARTFDVQLEQLEAIPIAFIRGIFGTDGSVLVQRYHELIAWAEKYGIPYQGALRRFGMSIDNPEVTPAGKYRYDFALYNPEAVPGEGLIEAGEIPGGTYATLHCQGSLEDVAQAWDYLYQHWLPGSTFVPVHYPAIEEFVQGPEEIGWDRFNIRCRVPITHNKD